MGDKDTLATTGFSRMSDRQIGIWETGSLKNIKMTTVDQSSGVLMPFWSDNNILFVGTSLASSVSSYLNDKITTPQLAKGKSRQIGSFSPF